MIFMVNPANFHRPSLLGFIAAITVSMTASIAQPAIAASDVASWQVVGRQGLLQVVIVPAERATDAAAYQAEVAKLCTPQSTCFINFFTNSSGAQAELPLPDAIANEATARFRRSMKNGIEIFQWSCRLKLGDGECF
jgi:hypothetical protein